MPKLSRRGLLRGAAGLAAGYWAREFLAESGAFLMAEPLDVPSAVVVEGTDSDTPEMLLRAALAPLGSISRFVKPGQTVCIKPNITWPHKPHTASSTDPDLLRALINMVKAAGAKRIIVVDNCVFDPPAVILAETGIGKVLDETGVERQLMDRLSEPHSKFVEVEVPGGKSVQRIGVIKGVAEADVRINMAVAKAHVSPVPITLCCKHLMGYLENPPALHATVQYLDQGIADIAKAPLIRSELHILEAIRVRLGLYRRSYGDETDLTHPHLVKRFNQILAGTDPVLIDAYATQKFFGVLPMEITHIKRCYESGAGEIDYEKAIREGRLRVFSPHEALRPTATPTPRATFTPTPEVAPTEQALTPTPLTFETPTPTVLPNAGRAGELVLDLSPRLDGSLLPLAAVIGGAGVLLGRRMVWSLHRAAAREEAQPDLEERDGAEEEVGDGRQDRA